MREVVVLDPFSNLVREWAGTSRRRHPACLASQRCQCMYTNMRKKHDKITILKPHKHRKASCNRIFGTSVRSFISNIPFLSLLTAFQTAPRVHKRSSKDVLVQRARAGNIEYDSCLSSVTGDSLPLSCCI